MSSLSLPRKNTHDTVNVEFQLSVIKPTTGINSNQICCQELPVQDQDQDSQFQDWEHGQEKRSQKQDYNYMLLYRKTVHSPAAFV